MTIVMISRSDDRCMEFAFDNEMDAFNFYASAKDSYREDDLCICMTEEGEDDEDLHFRTDEGVDEDALLSKLFKSGIFTNIDGSRGDKSMLY